MYEKLSWWWAKKRLALLVAGDQLLGTRLATYAAARWLTWFYRRAITKNPALLWPDGQGVEVQLTQLDVGAAFKERALVLADIERAGRLGASVAPKRQWGVNVSPADMRLVVYVEHAVDPEAQNVSNDAGRVAQKAHLESHSR